MPVATEEPLPEAAGERGLASEKWDDHQRKLQTWVKPSLKPLNRPMLRKRGEHQDKKLWRFGLLCVAGKFSRHVQPTILGTS